MKKILCFTLLALPLFCFSMDSPEKIKFKNGAALAFSRQGQDIALQIESAKGIPVATALPIRIEVFDGKESSTVYSSYSELKKSANGFDAKGEVEIDGAKLVVTDHWFVQDQSPALSRTLKVEGSSSKAFMSAIEFKFEGHNRSNTDYFAPGMIYGSTDNLTSNAIGGIDVYEKGDGKVWIREDRLPAPIMAFRFQDGNSFSILDSKPAGQTTLADTHTATAETIVDENLRFGSLFAEQKGEILKVGFAYPGSEGEFTYRGVTYPDGQLHKWRRRYHPMKDGLVQEYTISLNADSYPNFQNFYSTEYQLAFDKLKPKINYQDIELARRTMLATIPNLVIRKSNKVGLSNWYDSTDPEDRLVDNKAVDILASRLQILSIKVFQNSIAFSVSINILSSSLFSMVLII